MDKVQYWNRKLVKVWWKAYIFSWLYSIHEHPNNCSSHSPYAGWCGYKSHKGLTGGLGLSNLSTIEGGEERLSESLYYRFSRVSPPESCRCLNSDVICQQLLGQGWKWPDYSIWEVGLVGVSMCLEECPWWAVHMMILVWHSFPLLPVLSCDCSSITPWPAFRNPTLRNCLVLNHELQIGSWN